LFLPLVATIRHIRPQPLAAPVALLSPIVHHLLAQLRWFPFFSLSDLVLGVVALEVCWSCPRHPPAVIAIAIAKTPACFLSFSIVGLGFRAMEQGGLGGRVSEGDM